MTPSPRSLRVSALAVCMAALVLSHTHAHVVELDSNNFDKVVRDGHWMVEFYATWCTHCKKLEPIFEDAAKQLKGVVRFGRVESRSRSLMTRFGINGYPTLFFITHDAENGTTVRRAAVSHTTASIVNFAASGYKSMPALPATASPNGPVAMAKYYAMLAAEKVINLHEPLAEALGVPPMIVLFGMMMVAIVAVSGIMVCVAVSCGPKGLPRRREHAD